ncbi:hypothetical protein GCM10022384_27490 [Streptomyces marokkonensis]|uniref:Uncharacterized protein n=1 Tax=Streptomyces marokkonensis TaxID=324855 RepID=A0ABP7Q3C1_9ACTN
MDTTTRSGSPLGRTPLPSPDCRRCGFTFDLVRQGAVTDTLQEYAGRWQRLLRTPGLSNRRTGTLPWSPLESDCHVRDMCLLFHTRLNAILGRSAIAPMLSTGMHTDAARRYRDEEPQQVADELGRAAEALVRRAREQ